MHLRKHHDEEENIISLVSGYVWMADCGNWENKEAQKSADEIVTAVNERPALLARIAELEQALAPFAKLANKSSRALDVAYCEKNGITDETETVYGEDDEIITFGHLRRAAAVLTVRKQERRTVWVSADVTTKQRDELRAKGLTVKEMK